MFHANIAADIPLDQRDCRRTVTRNDYAEQLARNILMELIVFSIITIAPVES